MKFLKLILAVLIIVLGAGIGWYLADSANPYKPEKIAAAAATPSVAANTAPRQANTPIPTFTPATGAGAGNPTTPGAAGGVNPGAGAGGARTGGGGQVVTGTVEAYDASAKTLTVKTAAGQSVKVGATNAAVTKTEKVSSEDFAKLLSANSFVLLAGEKGGDGAYTAKSLTAIDVTSMFGGRTGAGAGANPGGGGAGAGAAGGTPGANPGGGQGGNRGAGAGAGANPGGAGAGAGGRFALPGMNGVVVRGGTLAGTKFSGNTIQGEAITANLSDSTNLLKQVSGTAADLKPGMSITLTAPAAQGGTQAEATLITITDAVAG